MTNAAREGARIAVLPGYTTPDVQARVASYISAAGLPGTATTTLTATSVVPGGGPAFPAAQVDVAYTHQFLFIGPMVTLIGGTFQQNLTFTATSTMRTELIAGP